MKEFLSKFHFDPIKSGMVGVERECFLTDLAGNIVPQAPKILAILNDRNRFGYELSACQLEERVGPCKVNQLKELLLLNDREISLAESTLGLKRLYTEVAPKTMPLDVYPDPTGRYAKIKKSMPKEVLLAACRIIGTHVHIGMPSHQVALLVYNKVIARVGEFLKLGDGSQGERLAIYKMVAEDCDPRPFKDWGDFYQEAQYRGCAQDPRKMWTLIRISIHGTIEFRMFGASPDLQIIIGWAQVCHDACSRAMKG